MHGFDEFFGILYHLNVMEQPEQPEYPKNPNFRRPARATCSTRWATDKDDATADPRFGKVGKQRIESAAQLGAKRMETFDDEVLAVTPDWSSASRRPPSPSSCGSTRRACTSRSTSVRSGWARAATAAMPMACCTWIRSSASCSSSSTTWASTNNTIVIFTSDNGVNLAHWPDAGTASFRGEKGMTWDGGFRVPMLVRWPGKVPANDWTGEFMTSEDWLPTLMAAVGDTDVKERLLKGTRIGEPSTRSTSTATTSSTMLTARARASGANSSTTPRPN